jgi:hypothetical protein
MNGPLSNLAALTNARTRRISSYDRTGGNTDSVPIEPGETITIADITGAGVIRHLWFTIAHKDPMHRRNMVLRMYWDGSATPSVACPVGDFFGQGWGEEYNFISLPLCASPRAGKALNCYFPMPFGNGARIEIENESGGRCDAFYYYVDYETLPALPADTGRFHAGWRRSVHLPAQGVENEWAALFSPLEPNLTDAQNHPIISTRGRGHYVGVNYYVESPSPIWYGEGDDMWFIDGEAWPPSLHGTGTEDYFNTAWCPRELYQHSYFGYGRINTGQTGWLGRTHVYRFHLEDPIRFAKSLRGSIEIGHANCVMADVVTAAYWYQQPCAAAPAVPPAAQRQNMPPIGALELHRWREAFRYVHGMKGVWGNEKLPPKLEKELRRRAAKKPLTTAATRQVAARELTAQKKMLKRRAATKR